jgi:Protein of unknown function (DUF4232)
MKPLLVGALAVTGLMACACSSPPTAAVPVKTVTITARPSVSQSPVTPTPSPPTTSPVAAACQTTNLSGAVGGSPEGTPRALVLVIVFRNLKNVPCTLNGYPRVAQAAGTPLADIGQPSAEDPRTPPTVVTLPPGGFASALLKIAYADNYLATSCKQVKATWLRVIPPKQTTPLNISFGTTACQGKAKLMTVTSVAQGSAG